MFYDGYKYGEFKVSENEVRWRCTMNSAPDNDNRVKRCSVMLTTKKIKGYEMVRDNQIVKHDHPKKDFQMPNYLDSHDFVTRKNREIN